MSIDLAIADAPATAPSDSSVTFPQRTASRTLNVTEQMSVTEQSHLDESLAEHSRAGQGRGVQSEFASTTVVAEKTAIAQKSLLSDFITLTKPRIISLLLVITFVPMFLAGEAPPGGWLILSQSRQVNFSRTV